MVTPIVKDSQGDVSDTSNYRGITLSCLPAKLFEFTVQLKTSHLVGMDDLQFGFKSKTGTCHALFALRSTVDYFVNEGSKVYVTFLDCTKAFDRISHFGLFTKLINCGFPLCYLLCLIYWYSNMSCRVKWGSQYSRSFEIPLGIKQGGINSPDFFSLHMDDLIRVLRNLKIGCHIHRMFIAMILFADDICLMAPTRSALQSMINACESYRCSHGLLFNAKKSKVMIFSKVDVDYTSFEPIMLNGCVVEYVDSEVSGYNHR